MNPLNNIISITTKIGTTCFELESFVHQNLTDSTKSIEDKIKHYDDFLEKLTINKNKNQ